MIVEKTARAAVSAPGEWAGNGVKECPRCGSLLFDDMDICYGCLYDFSRDVAHAREPLLPDMDLNEPDDMLPSAPGGGTMAQSARPQTAPPDETAVMEAPRRTQPVSALPSLCICTADVDVCVPLPEAGLTVGRSPSNDVVLHAREVSRSHALFRPTAGGCLVQDLGATNPVVCRLGELVDSIEMRAGESVDICGARFTLVVPAREP